MTTILWSLVRAAFQIIFSKENASNEFSFLRWQNQNNSLTGVFMERRWEGSKEGEAVCGKVLIFAGIKRWPQVVSALVFWLGSTVRMIPLFLDINQYILKLLLSRDSNRDRYYRSFPCGKGNIHKYSFSWIKKKEILQRGKIFHFINFRSFNSCFDRMNEKHGKVSIQKSCCPG